MRCNYTLFVTLLSIGFQTISAQVVLKADGKTNTYNLINTILSPGYDGAVETPDCKHNVPHITQQWDKTLNTYVFNFEIHADLDNDRCKNEDRQRLEIKTYKQSPDNLIAFSGDSVIYSWKFKLDANFQPSKGFTHIHQLKAIGGSEEKMPLITFTLRKKSSGNLFQIRYAANLNQEDLLVTSLNPFLDKWVAVTEIVTYGESGNAFYKVVITDIKTGKTLIDYQNKELRMWKTNATLLRPKWGIYRSLKDVENLRDENILFADFTIQKI